VYQPGTLTAVVYDEGGKEIARASLQTAQQETQLTLCPEEPEVKADELCYVRLHYTDGAGTIKPLARGEITLQVEGAKLLAFGNACSYNQRGYLTDTSDTYYGQALAVLQPLGEGTITLQAQSPYGAASACIPCTAAET
jgi:beta-galactosidase